MIFDIDGLEVFFPYDRMYQEQYQYMRSLKQILDAGGHGLLEMPTGTGKTVCLLSLVTSYQYARPKTGKLIYATRTVPEMNHVMQELLVVLTYRASAQRQRRADSTIDLDPGSTNGVRKKARKQCNSRTGCMGPDADSVGAGGSGILALCLSSRRNMCINKVVSESDGEAVDAACRSRTASWVVDAKRAGSNEVETCEFYDQFVSIGEANSLPSGVYDLAALKSWGEQKGWCPYFLTRLAINHAHILVFNYQYLLDPKVCCEKVCYECEIRVCLMTRELSSPVLDLLLLYLVRCSKVAKMVSKELEAESIVVFDEAHNIDSVCIEALSVTLNDRTLEQATRSLGRLSSEVARQKAQDNTRLQAEYENLLNGLLDQGLLNAPHPSDLGLASVRTMVVLIVSRASSASFHTAPFYSERVRS
jgi:DNA excision repair protein ERCC-2